MLNNPIPKVGMAQCLLHVMRIGALLNNPSPMVLPRVGPMSIAFQ